MNDRTASRGLVSDHCSGLAMSAIKEMAILSASVPGTASLAWGLPSFRTPEAIRAAAIEALDNDPTAGMYTLPAGLPELRAAAAADFESRFQRSTDPDRNITIGAGNMESVGTVLSVLLDPGDEVIMTDPGFASHIQQIRARHGVPVFWPMDEARGWELDVEALPALIGPRTRAILLVTPSNPTGRVFSEETLRATAALAREHGLLLIFDDPYSQFSFGALGNWHPCSDPSLAEHVAYLFTFSKVHAMSGWRTSYMVLPEALRDQVVKIHDLTMICTPRVSQLAALAALRSDKSHVEEFRSVLSMRRQLICERLDRLAHVFSYARPEGAYYVFPRILIGHEDSATFARDLLFDTKVTVTPGAAFGPSGEHHVRMAFCVDEATIDRAFDRLEKRFPA